MQYMHNIKLLLMISTMEMPWKSKILIQLQTEINPITKRISYTEVAIAHNTESNVNKCISKA